MQTPGGDGMVLLGRRHGEARERSESVVRLTGTACGRAACPARDAVAVGHGRDGQRFGVGRRRGGREVHGTVPRSHDVGDARCRRPADRLMERVEIRVAAVVVVRPAPAEAHARDLDVERRRVRGHPVDPADDLPPRARALPVEDLHRIDLAPGRNADNTCPVVPRPDRAGHVCPVAVVVIRACAARDAVLPRDRVQVRVSQLDARVDDRDRDGRGLVRIRCARRVDAADARGCGVTRSDRDASDRMDLAIGTDELHLRIAREGREMGRAQRGGEAFDRV